MTIFAVGNEQDSYHYCPYVVFGTNACGPNTDFNAKGFSGTPYGLDFSAVSECWVHMRFYRSLVAVGSTTIPVIALRNTTTGKDALRVHVVQTTGDLDFKYNNTGTTYTTIDSRSFGADNTIELDFYFKRGASGVLKAWSNRILIIDKTGTYNTVDTAWDRLVLQGNNLSVDEQFSDVMAGDAPMFGYSTQTLKPSAAGAVSGWSGSYTSLIGVNGAADDTTAVYTDTVADSFTTQLENMVTPAAYEQIYGVSISAIGAISDSASISAIAFYARHAATNYTLNSLGASAGDGPVRFQQFLANNPAGGAWSESDVNAFELGAITS